MFMILILVTVFFIIFSVSSMFISFYNVIGVYVIMYARDIYLNCSGSNVQYIGTTDTC